MNNYFNDGFKEDKKISTRLPMWIWIIGVFGLVIAILSGYFYGMQAVDVYGQMISSIIIDIPHIH